jgi:hypothetical protein
MSDLVFVRFERGRDEVMGPTFGPYEFFQQTYGEFRVSPDGEPLACWSEKAGEWFIISGEHEGEFYSDFIVYSADKPDGESEHHDCAAGKVTSTISEGCDTEQKWDDEKEEWVPTGRMWDSEKGEWSSNLKKFTVVGIVHNDLRFADHVEAENAQAAENFVCKTLRAQCDLVIAGVFEGFLIVKDER